MTKEAEADLVGVRVMTGDLEQARRAVQSLGALLSVRPHSRSKDLPARYFEWVQRVEKDHAAIRDALDRAALSSIEPTPSPEPQASNAGAVGYSGLVSILDEMYAPVHVALSTPEPQTGERDGEDEGDISATASLLNVAAICRAKGLHVEAAILDNARKENLAERTARRNAERARDAALRKADVDAESFEFWHREAKEQTRRAEAAERRLAEVEGRV